MIAIKDFGRHPMHGLIDELGRVLGVPKNPGAVVHCCDCGKEVMAAHCAWFVSKIPPYKSSGPHCGCVKREEKDAEKN